MFENPLSTSTKKTHDNVLIATSKGVPLDELGHSLVPRRYISEHNMKMRITTFSRPSAHDRDSLSSTWLFFMSFWASTCTMVGL